MRAAIFVCVSAILVLSPLDLVRANTLESSGRQLPRLLGDDDTLIGLFPGSASVFSPRLVFERDDRVEYYLIDDILFSTRNQTLQGMALVGSRWKFAYLASGPWQGAVAGSPGGLGVSLAYRQALTEDEEGIYNDRLEPWEEPDIEIESVTSDFRQLRLGLGWRHQLESGRSLEVSAGLSWLDMERSWTGFDDFIGLRERNWKSDFGTVIEVAGRTLHPESGLQLAARYLREDPDPVYDEEPELNVDPGRTQMELHAGWRFSHPEIDDAVAGISAVWGEAESHVFDEYCCGYPLEHARLDRVFEGQVFISLERRITGTLFARGGIRSGIFHQRIENVRWNRSDTSEHVRGNTESDWVTRNPEFRLGASWTWNRYTMDFLLDERLDLYAPLYGWALRIDL